MKKENLIKLILLLGDIVLMYIALFLSIIIRNGTFLMPEVTLINVFLYNFSILYVFWVIFLFTLDFYEIPLIKDKSSFMTNLTVFAFFSLFMGIAYFYLRQDLIFTPKTTLILNILVFSFLLFLWRYLFEKLVIKNLKQKIIIVGFPQWIEKALPYIKSNGYEISGLFLQGEAQKRNDFDIRYLYKIKDINNLVDSEKINLIIFDDDLHKDKKLVREIFSSLPGEMKFLSFSDFYEMLSKRISLDSLDELWFMQKARMSQSKIYDITKRVFDIFLALIFLLITAIFLPFFALAIRLDSRGPVFYNQERVGKNGRVFMVRKFRTMTDDKNRSKEIWREKKDGEITKVGKFLRRFHLDELPQCLSILKGDLSFVGPRPEWTKIAKIFEKEIPFYHQRYLVNPGFTGWAQINYPPSNSIEEAKEKFEYDLYYIKNRSLLLDIEIILKTVRLILKHRM